MKKHLIATVSGSLMLAACAQAPDPLKPVPGKCMAAEQTGDSKYVWNHVIADRNGRSVFEINKQLNDIEAHITPGKHVVIFAHGGLVTESDIVGRANKISSVIDKQYADIVPIFLIWRTGPLESYGDEISRLGNGDADDNIATAPLNIVENVTSGLVRAPTTTMLLIKRMWGLAQDSS